MVKDAATRTQKEQCLSSVSIIVWWSRASFSSRHLTFRRRSSLACWPIHEAARIVKPNWAFACFNMCFVCKTFEKLFPQWQRYNGYFFQVAQCHKYLPVLSAFLIWPCWYGSSDGKAPVSCFRQSLCTFLFGWSSTHAVTCTRSTSRGLVLAVKNKRCLWGTCSRCSLRLLCEETWKKLIKSSWDSWWNHFGHETLLARKSRALLNRLVHTFALVCYRGRCDILWRLTTRNPTGTTDRAALEHFWMRIYLLFVPIVCNLSPQPWNTL